jgi:multidrug transporter EmrE-like cation transporter
MEFSTDLRRAKSLSPRVVAYHRTLGSRKTDRTSILLVLLCTFLGAAAQILMKTGGSSLAGLSVAQVLSHPQVLLRSLPLFAGYSLYGISTILLVLSLRRGQLSVLYPIISLTYVWVLLLSVAIFGEHLNFWKVAGVTSIVAGVSFLGRGPQA